MIDALLTAPGWYAAGMTILHSFWQASVLALLLWTVSRMEVGTAATRYRLGCGFLLLQVGFSIATFLHYYEPGSPVAVVQVLTLAETATVIPPSTSQTTWRMPEFWLTALVACWILSMGIGTLRLGLSYGRVRRMVSCAEPVTATGPHRDLYQRVTALADRLGLACRLRLGISDAVSGPVLVGHLKPMLLFPVALVNQLTTEEAETVILHELAHLRRYDHLVNPLQCLVEVLFYYHPAVHWISARVREEREHCCDDLVLRHGPGRLAYARALLYFGTHVGTPAPNALSLTEGGNLLARVRRFVDNQEKKYTMNTRLLLLPLFALVTLVASAAYTPATDPGPATSSFPDDPAPALAAPDTLPQGTHQVTRISNGKTTRLRVENGAIQELELEGRLIPESEYGDYEATAEELLGGNPADRTRSRDTIIRFDPGTYEADTTIIYRSLGQFDGMPLKMHDWSKTSAEVERALAQLREIDMERVTVDFQEMAIHLDSVSGALQHMLKFDAVDGDGFIDLQNMGLDSFDFDFPNVGVILGEDVERLKSEERHLRRLHLEEQDDIDQINEQQRILRETLEMLEERKRKLSEAKGSGGGAFLYLQPTENFGHPEQAIAHQKAAARRLRREALADARRQREARGPSLCPVTGESLPVLAELNTKIDRLITVKRNAVPDRPGTLVIRAFPG